MRAAKSRCVGEMRCAVAGRDNPPVGGQGASALRTRAWEAAVAEHLDQAVIADVANGVYGTGRRDRARPRTVRRWARRREIRAGAPARHRGTALHSVGG